MTSDWLVYTFSFPQTILLHLLHFVTRRVFGGFRMDSFCSNRCQRRGTLVLMPIWGHTGIVFFPVQKVRSSHPAGSVSILSHIYTLLNFLKIIKSPLFTNALLLVYNFVKALHCCNTRQITRVNLPQLYKHHYSGHREPSVSSNHFCFQSKTDKKTKTQTPMHIHMYI